MTGLWIALGVVGLLGLYVVVAYNRFIAQQQSIASTWSGIDVQLQRRHDLIPNLVETVKGYAAHEQQVLEAVVDARARAVNADRDPGAGPEEQARAENILTGALRRLFAVAEGYPDLKASRNFLELQHQLTETEDRIAAARRLYNIEVQHYNRRLESVPSNLIAAVFGFERAAYFEIEDRAAVAAPPDTSF
ncbi:MAG: LemA family protein [Nitriliruptorales bacterium]|nr:LemA family protein [Nitriliruptorales bacterium]